jgi:hypothetical protein
MFYYLTWFINYYFFNNKKKDFTLDPKYNKIKSISLSGGGFKAFYFLGLIKKT